MIYFVAKKSTLAKTRQWILLRRDSTQDFVWESETEYYTNRLLLNDIYPQIGVFTSAADPIQYQAEWKRILAEYEN